MLYTSVVTLYLVCFLHCFEPVQCRSTRHPNEYNNRSSLTRRCLRSCSLISRHQTCFEKCLGKNKDGDFTDLNARILRINPPHLTSTFKRRKRYAKGAIPCPKKTQGNNSFPTSRALVRQYENSSEWYLNISWDSLPDSPNLTGYGLKYLCNFKGVYIDMQKNETFKILNVNESCWRPDIQFWYIVLGLPCLGYDGLTDYKTPSPPSSPATPSVKAPSPPSSPATPSVKATVSTKDKVSSTVTVATTDKLFSTASEGTANFDEFSTKDDADYDAFVIFNHNDQKWVQETLLPTLEKESHYKCCVHYRDFAPGEDFVVNMTESVRRSKKVIAVISKTFFSSHWCNFELQQAIYQHIKKGNNGVIVIKIDNVSTEMFPKAIQTKSFIDYSNRVERPFFKTRLLKALESSSNAYKKDIIPMKIDG